VLGLWCLINSPYIRGSANSSFFVVALFGDVFQCAGRDDPKHKCFYWVHTLGLKKKVPLLSRLCLCVVCLDVVC
jgi:hypothetical protein